MAAGLLCCVDISLYYECTALDLQVDLGSHTYDQTVNWCCEQLFAHTVACSDRAVGHHHARCCAAARFFLLELDCICILLKKFTGLIIGGLRRRLRERERERPGAPCANCWAERWGCCKVSWCSAGQLWPVPLAPEHRSSAFLYHYHDEYVMYSMLLNK
jgi:hypothetical protein